MIIEGFRKPCKTPLSYRKKCTYTHYSRIFSYKMGVKGNIFFFGTRYPNFKYKGHMNLLEFLTLSGEQNLVMSLEEQD